MALPKVESNKTNPFTTQLLKSCSILPAAPYRVHSSALFSSGTVLGREYQEEGSFEVRVEVGCVFDVLFLVQTSVSGWHFPSLSL